MTATGARARVRAELTAEILTAAKAQLAEHGSAALSLRAVAREVGMVSSAVYRYFPSRDHLLTALIVDAYDSLGEAAERGAVTAPDLGARWHAICSGVRRWALDHPHEYALIYGSPVPGYQAPETTIGPATRVALVLVQLISDARDEGRLDTATPIPPLPDSLGADLDRLRLVFADIPDAVIVRAIVAWSALFGMVSFELFGQFHNVVDTTHAFFVVAVTELARFVGIPADPEPRR